MGLGKRQRETQGTFWVPTDKLGSGPRNVFHDRLNGLLAEADFDRWLEEAASPYYETTGRKSLRPSVYVQRLDEVLAEECPTLGKLELSLHIERIDCHQDGHVEMRTCKPGAMPTSRSSVGMQLGID